MARLTHTARRAVTRVFNSHTIPAVILAFFTAMTTACGSKDSPSSPKAPDGAGSGSIVGSYSLQQVEGRGLPATIFDDDVETEDGRTIRVQIAVTNGSLDLDNDKRFSGSLALRLTAQGQSQNESLPIKGEYSRSGNTISFDSDDPDDPNFEGTIRNGRLELALDIFGSGSSVTYSFKK